MSIVSNVIFLSDRLIHNPGIPYFDVSCITEKDITALEGLIEFGRAYSNDTDEVIEIYLTIEPEKVESILGLEIGKAREGYNKVLKEREVINVKDAEIEIKDLFSDTSYRKKYDFLYPPYHNYTNYFWGEFNALQYKDLKPDAIVELFLKHSRERGLLVERKDR